MNSLAVFLQDVWFAVGVHLWQTAIVLVPVLVLARWFARVPARALDILWGLALLKLLLPAAFIAELMALPAHIAPLLSRLGLATVSPADTWIRVIDPSLGVTATARDSTLLGPALLLLTVLWAVVAVVSILRSVKELGRPDATEVVALAGPQRIKLERAAAAAGVPIESIVVHGRDTLPFVTGLLSPRLHLPSRLVHEMTNEDLVAVLLHEHAHARRRDPLRRALYRALDAVLFFYPVWWFLRGKLEESAELVCDDFVLRAGVPAESYSRALARCLASNLVADRPSFAAAMAEGGFLKRRLISLTRRGRFTVMSRSGIMLLSALVLVTAGSLAPVVITGCGSESDQTAGTESPVSSPAATVAVTKEGAAADMQELDEMPKLIEMGKVEYPESARKAGAEGMVLIKAKVSAEGKVAEAEIESGVEGYPELGDSALNAVREATFTPGILDGKPVESWVKIPVKFALN